MLTLDQGKPLHAEAYDEVDELVAYWRRRPRTPSGSRGGCRTPSRPASACCSSAGRAASSA